MRHKIKNIIFVVIIFNLIISKSFSLNQTDYNSLNTESVLPSLIDENMILTKDNSPYIVKSNVTISENAILTIKPGVKLLIENNYKFYVYGAIRSIGTTDDKVTIKEFEDKGIWGGINFLNNKNESFLSFTEIFNGIIYADSSKLRFINSSFINNNIDLTTPFLYLKSSEIFIKNCNILSNNSGDAIVIENGENIVVTNSRFSGTKDAIECSNVDYGLIEKNIITDSFDDCIDLNGSSNIDIIGNILSNAVDKGISIGNNFNRTSTGIKIINNIIVSCKYGVSLKGNSYSQITNNTLYKLETGIYCYQQSEEFGGGNAIITNTIYSKCKLENYADKYSSINISYSLSDNKLLTGNNNIYANPDFVEPANGDFTLNPDSPCINAGNPASPLDKDGTRADIGALPYYIKLKKIIINEINYNSSINYDPDDWIELFNPDNNTINLSNWKIVFSDNSNFIFPENTFINKDSFLVIIRDSDKFSNLYSNVINKMGNFNFDLSGNGTYIKLIDSYERLIDSVYFTGSEPWPEKANGFGATLELINPNKNNNMATNWKASENHGTPGKINDSFVSYVNDNTLFANNMNNHFIIYPNPTQGNLNIKLIENSYSKIKFKIFDIQGKEKKIKKIINFNNNSDIKLILDKFPPGTYLIVINIDKRVFSQKFDITK